MSSYLQGSDIICGASPPAVVGDAAPPKKNGEDDIHGGVYLIALLLGALASAATLVEFVMFMKRGRRR